MTASVEASYKIVHLKWGERPQEAADPYVLIVRQGRARGDDFYVRSSAAAEAEIAATRAFFAEESFASLASAMRQAETVAGREGAQTIYVRMS
jgi:hypothetical protein